MSERAVLVRLKNGETYLGISLNIDKDDVTIRMWDKHKKNFEGNVLLMSRADTITIMCPRSGQSDEEFAEKIVREAEEAAKEAEERNARMSRANRTASGIVVPH